jgi:hypothetical protein
MISLYQRDAYTVTVVLERLATAFEGEGNQALFEAFSAWDDGKRKATAAELRSIVQAVDEQMPSPERQ